MLLGQKHASASTSVLTLDIVHQASFGPVHPEGFGVSYHVPGDELRFCITAYRPARDATQFGDELRAALDHVGELLALSQSEQSELRP